ncbi:MAG: hypothetical protein AAGI88_24250 [Pseudomonadota bacterium]
MTNTPVEERSPAISPDGKYLAFLTNKKYGAPNQVGILKVEDGNMRLLSSNLNLQDGIFWHDAQTLMAGDVNAHGGRIVSIDVQTGSVSTVYKDQRRVAFVSKGVAPGTLLFSRLNKPSAELPNEPNYAIWQLNLTTSNAIQLYDSPSRDLQPMAMPNGGISFFSRMHTQGDSDEIYALDPRTKKPTRLLENQGDDFGPAPSPNGRWIAFANNSGKRPALFILDTVSGSVQPLPAMDKRLSQPAWSPDGKHLYFVARRTALPADIYRLSISSSPRS